MLKTLEHPNIVSYHDMYIIPHMLQFEVGILMEYCSGGSLREVLEKQVRKCFSHWDPKTFDLLKLNYFPGDRSLVMNTTTKKKY